MSDAPYSSPLLGKRDKPESNLSVGVFIAALILALLIGLSAANIQSDRATGADQTQPAGKVEPVLDGRGKWGGYM